MREKEVEWAIEVMEELSRKITLEEDTSKIIRRERDHR